MKIKSILNIVYKTFQTNIENWVSISTDYSGRRGKRFVNVYLHCIVSNLKRISKISTLPAGT